VGVVDFVTANSSADSSAGSSDPASSNASGDSSRGSANSSNEASTEQSSAESSRSSTNNSSEATTADPSLRISTTVGGSLTVVTIGVVVWGLAAGSSRVMAASRDAVPWLRMRSLQARVDFVRGSGPFVEELATVSGIRAENLQRFGDVVRASRASLLPLLPGESLDDAGAASFLRALGSVLESDEVLAADGRAFVQGAGG